MARSPPCAEPRTTKRTAIGSRSLRPAKTIPTIPTFPEVEPSGTGWSRECRERRESFRRTRGARGYERLPSPRGCPRGRHRVQLDGKDLVLSAAGEPPPDVIDMLRRHKLSIVALCSGPPPAALQPISHGTEMTGGPTSTSARRSPSSMGPSAGPKPRRGPSAAASPNGCAATRSTRRQTNASSAPKPAKANDLLLRVGRRRPRRKLGCIVAVFLLGVQLECMPPSRH